MSKPRVYVETTIPSAYYTDRADPAMVERRDTTRTWWSLATASCELVSSQAVLGELRMGTSPHVPSRLALLEELQLVEVTAAALDTAELYVARKLMPSRPSDDALHLALASHYTCEVLVTWNYRHLANATKTDRIRRINVRHGLSVPRILTPAQLLGGGDGAALAP